MHAAYLLRRRATARLAQLCIARAGWHSHQPRNDNRCSDNRRFTGGGGFHSTGCDYLTFLRMLLNGGRLNGAEILRPETVALMGQSHIARAAPVS